MEDENFYDDEDQPMTGVPNWADWLNVLICIPFYFTKGLMRMFEGANALLDLQSKRIDERRDFANAVHEAIESIDQPRKED